MYIIICSNDCKCLHLGSISRKKAASQLWPPLAVGLSVGYNKPSLERSKSVRHVSGFYWPGIWNCVVNQYWNPYYSSTDFRIGLKHNVNYTDSANYESYSTVCPLSIYTQFDCTISPLFMKLQLHNVTTKKRKFYKVSACNFNM